MTVGGQEYDTVAFSLFRKKDNEATKPGPSGPVTQAPSSVQPNPSQTATPQLDSPADNASYNLSDLMIEVEDASGHLSPAEEEAVVLYANGQLAAAIESLKGALPTLAGSRPFSSWALMFDLLQLAGDRATFDEMALQYVVEFEASPPLWREMHSKPMAKTTASRLVTLASELGAGNAQTEVAKILKACENGGPVRLDCSRVGSVDATAAAELLALWPRARKFKASLQLLGADNLSKLLASNIETGRRNPSEAPFWLLLMELKQTMGEQDDFDNLAIDYAVTFEVSPPSWDAKLVAKVAPITTDKTPAADEAPISSDRLALTGDLTGGATEVMNRIRSFAHDQSKPVLDFSAVGRVDFESAGQILNIGVELMQSGKITTIVGANEPIAGLFKLMGITELMPLSKS